MGAGERCRRDHDAVPALVASVSSSEGGHRVTVRDVRGGRQGPRGTILGSGREVTLGLHECCEWAERVM